MYRCIQFVSNLAVLLTMTTSTSHAQWQERSKKPLADVVLDKTILGYLFDNFHKVEKGRCYRSKQLSAGKLKHYIDRLDLKTILNLRGKHTNEKWWRKEAALAKSHNIKLIDVGLSSQKLPPPDAIATILDTFKHAQTPLLIHCFQGCDRTGMISALWKFEQMGAPLRKAKKQCTFFPYCHVKSKRPAMRAFLRLWTTLRSQLNREEALDRYREIYNKVRAQALAKVEKKKQSNQTAKRVI